MNDESKMTNFEVSEIQPILTFLNEPQIEIMRISKSGIWANPEVPVDETAKKVLEVLENNIKNMVNKAIEDERKLHKQLLKRFANELIEFTGRRDAVVWVARSYGVDLDE